MTPRPLFLASFIIALVSVYFPNVYAEAEMSIEDLKAGVVRITSTLDGRNRVGTGIIVKLEDDTAYIVTASHVIEGDPEPQVTFYTKPNKRFPARTLGIEGGDPRGLAALLVEGTLPSGLRVLRMDANPTIHGGERVTLIGFPRVLGTPWAITSGTLAGQKGRDLTFSGAADEGNSGGPLLIDGKVVGVVTQTSGQFGYASPTVTTQYALRGWGVGVKTSTSEISVKSASTEKAKIDSTSEEVERLKRELEEANQTGQARAAEAARVQSELDAVKELERLREVRYALEETEKKRQTEIEQLRKELDGLKVQGRENVPDEAPSENQVDSILSTARTAAPAMPIEEARVRPYDAPTRLAKEITGKDGAPMVLVPAGTFVMGSDKGEEDEKPAHEVELDAFYIDKYEVTTSRYAKFIRAAGWEKPKYWSQVSQVSQDRPVVSVTWNDAKTYCERYDKRLPTEAEWEKAARATDERIYPWGYETPTSRHANFDNGGDFNYGVLDAVGSHEAGASPYGVYDMAGNVYEWIADWYDKDYYKQGPKRTLKGPSDGTSRVIRGGSWSSGAESLRSSDRLSFFAKWGNIIIGFRCAKDAP